MDIILRQCDLHHASFTAISPSADVTRREFSIDGHDYEIDLCAAHDQPFMDMIGRWAQAAHPGAKPRPERQGRRSRAGRERSAAIRAWAIATGKHLETGGRLPVSVIRDYDQAHRA